MARKMKSSDRITPGRHNAHTRKPKTKNQTFLNAIHKHIKPGKSEILMYSSKMNQLTYVTWFVTCIFAATTT